MFANAALSRLEAGATKRRSRLVIGSSYEQAYSLLYKLEKMPPHLGRGVPEEGLGGRRPLAANLFARAGRGKLITHTKGVNICGLA